MNCQVYIVSLASFAAVSAVAYGLLAWLSPYRLRVRSRMSQMDGGENGHAAANPDSGVLNWLCFPIVRGVERVFSSSVSSPDRLQKHLAKAGLYAPQAVTNFYLLRALGMLFAVGIAAGFGFAGYLRIDLAILASCGGALLMSLLPNLWLKHAVARQHVKLSKSLPDLLDLMTVCLEGGLSLQETIRRVSDELRLAHPELAMELFVVQRDVELGATVDKALKRFAVRTDHEGVRTLSTFIREAQKFGTNITEALRNHADMLRTEREYLAEEKAQKASVKILLPTLFFIFPAIFVVAVGPAAFQIYEAFCSTK